MKRIFTQPSILLFLFLFPCLVQAQNVGIELNSRTKEILDRFEILGLDSMRHSTIGVPTRDEVANLAVKCAAEGQSLQHRTDEADLQYLLDETALCSPEQTNTSFGHQKREKPILKHFYPTNSQFFVVNTPEFRLVVNPVLDLRLGKESGKDGNYFRNERGIVVFGDIARKVQFYTSLHEIQANLPTPYQQWAAANKSKPGFALAKVFQGSINKNFTGFDTNISEAHISGNFIKQIRFQFGHGRHQIGNGYRSMLLSDFSPVYLYLRLDTRVWRFHYTNLFTEMSATQSDLLLGGAEKKNVAAHYLDFNVTKNWSVGIYETTVFSRPNGFEAQYLNPVIFYRSVEGMIGSPDNVLIGLNTKINLFKTAQVYGQFMLDEFFSEAYVNPSERGWWANKTGTQIGIKYLNAFKINHLDLQVEANRVRPYTFSHANQLTSYTHYGQSLAHPLGANFRELVGIVKYQAGKRVFLDAKLLSWTRGHDFLGDTISYGGDPWKSYNTRRGDFGNEVGQGIETKVTFMQMNVTYMLAHNLYLEATINRRTSKTDSVTENATFGTLGVRWNAWRRREEI